MQAAVHTMRTIKGIGEGGKGNHLFHNLVLFYRVLTKLQDAFYKFKKFKITFEM